MKLSKKTSRHLQKYLNYLKDKTASYSDTSSGENLTTKLAFFPAGILPLSGSITKGNMSLPPSLTTLPASYARVRTLEGLRPTEELGRGIIGVPRVWGGVEESPTEVEGRPVRWSTDCPPKLAGRSGPDSRGSAKFTDFGFSTCSNFHW